ncbi:MAG TPA: hypothetical protein VEV21_13115 [Burkholderiales bacterium]|nr:hypothetical protein [Burkholderiales bacterium]
MIAHSTPQVFVAYAPQGPGLRCAMFYVAAGDDLWGWFTGPQGTLLITDYFRVAGFHALREPRYAVVDIAGLHCGWAEDQAMCGELARLQEQFARDWLFYRSAKGARAELAAYERSGLATGEVNLRFARLASLARTAPDWTYCSAAFEPAVLNWLGERWPLDYRPAAVAVRLLDGAAAAHI